MSLAPDRSGAGARPRAGDGGVALAIAAAALLFLPGALEAQSARGSASSAAPSSPPIVRFPAVQEDTSATTTVSPGGAFLRSLAVPGWGHAAIGSYGRAGFYFVTSAGVGWMLFKTLHFLDAAQEQRDLVEREVEAGLERKGITDPEILARRVDEDPRVQGIRSLVDSRSQQREDWTAFGIFWLLLNATDAFVSAHLTDFPEPVEIDVRGAAARSGGELRISVPVGGF